MSKKNKKLNSEKMPQRKNEAIESQTSETPKGSIGEDNTTPEATVEEETGDKSRMMILKNFFGECRNSSKRCSLIACLLVIIVGIGGILLVSGVNKSVTKNDGLKFEMTRTMSRDVYTITEDLSKNMKVTLKDRRQRSIGMLNLTKTDSGSSEKYNVDIKVKLPQDSDSVTFNCITLPTSKLLTLKHKGDGKSPYTAHLEIDSNKKAKLTITKDTVQSETVKLAEAKPFKLQPDSITSVTVSMKSLQTANAKTEKSISILPILLNMACVIISLVLYIFLYNKLYKKRLPRLREILEVGTDEELEAKIAELKEKSVSQETEIQKLILENGKLQNELAQNQNVPSICSSEEQKDEAPEQNTAQTAVSDTHQEVVTIEEIQSIQNLHDVKDKKDALQKISELSEMKENADRFVNLINETLHLDDPISLKNSGGIQKYLKKENEQAIPGAKEQSPNEIVDSLIRNSKFDNIKQIWKTNKDAQKFFDVLGSRIKSSEGNPEKEFLNRLKHNGFDDLIVDNTTVLSLWGNVERHFDAKQKESEKKLTEEKDQEIATKDKEIEELKQGKKELAEKIKSRANKDFNIDLEDTDDASSAFESFCVKFKTLKDDLVIIKKLKQLLKLSDDQHIDREHFKDNIRDSVACELAVGCPGYDNLKNFNGIRSKLIEVNNQLSSANQRAEEAQKRIDKENSDIQKAYQELFKVDLDSDGIESCFSAFNNKAKETIDGLQNDVSERDSKIRDKENTIAEHEKHIAKLTSDVENKQQQIKEYGEKLVIRLQQDMTKVAQSVNNNKFLVSSLSDGGFASKLPTIYKNIEDGASSLEDIVLQFKVNDFATPEEILRSVQELLKTEIDKPEGFINQIVKYYAYSRLPFMADDNAEYGLQFNRAAIKNIYELIVQMLADFNITLQLPVLFAEYDKDWQYENVTGKEAKGLDYLIPDAANHIEKVDNSAKNGLILDFAEIGYCVDGETAKLTKIIL